MRNSNRLNALLDISPTVDTVADIGCDHALLTIKFIKAKKAKRGVASDISEKSLRKAIKYIEEEELDADIVLRVGDGLNTIKKGETDLIAISGMGGDLIADIIKRNPDIARSADYLLLSPHTSVAVLRKFLNENGFKALNEELVKDGKRIYQIMLYGPGNEKKYFENELEFGRKNIEKNCPLLKTLVKKRISDMQRMSEVAKEADSARAINAYNTAVKRLSELKEFIKKL